METTLTIIIFVDRYLIASHTTDYQHPMLFFNTLAVFVLVVAKFPNMHKVRIFGINADKWVGTVIKIDGITITYSKELLVFCIEDWTLMNNIVCNVFLLAALTSCLLENEGISVSELYLYSG